MTDLFSGTLGFVVITYMIITGILWFILPFVVFSINDKLSKILKQMQKENNSSKDKYKPIYVDPSQRD